MNALLRFAGFARGRLGGRRPTVVMLAVPFARAVLCLDCDRVTALAEGVELRDARCGHCGGESGALLPLYPSDAPPWFAEAMKA